MTDKKGGPSVHSQQKYTKYRTAVDEGAREKAAAPARRRHSVAGGRIAAAGIGIAAMLGLVANMEVAEGNAKAVTPAKASATSAQRTAKGAGQGTAAAPGKVAAAKVKRPSSAPGSPPRRSNPPTAPPG